MFENLKIKKFLVENDDIGKPSVGRTTRAGTSDWKILKTATL